MSLWTGKCVFVWDVSAVCVCARVCMLQACECGLICGACEGQSRRLGVFFYCSLSWTGSSHFCLSCLASELWSSIYLLLNAVVVKSTCIHSCFFLCNAGDLNSSLHACNMRALTHKAISPTPCPHSRTRTEYSWTSMLVSHVLIWEVCVIYSQFFLKIFDKNVKQNGKVSFQDSAGLCSHVFSRTRI